MDANITGGSMPSLNIALGGSESVYAQSGAMLYMTGDVQMNVEMKGGLLGGIKRKVSGESAFLTTYEAQGAGGSVGLAAPYPGSIARIDLSGGREVMAERGGFLAATTGVDQELAFQKKLGAGFLGGEGFILQKLSGEGSAWVHAGGSFVEFDLQPGQVLRVDTGCLVWFDTTVSYDIERTGGIKKSLFSGEGLFLAKLTGPGHVALQTLPFGKMAQAIASAAMTGGGAERGGVLGGLGNFLEN